MDAVKHAASALLIAALAGCSSTWRSGEAVTPTSYAAVADAVPRYAGKLRRLLLVPTVYEPVAEECSPVPVADAGRWLDEAARVFLADWKGYEVLAPGDGLAADALAQLARDLGRWQEREPDARLPPAAQREQLRRLAAARGADGVVVLHAAPECIGILDTTLMIFAVGMPNFYGKALGRNFSGGLYEAAAGTLVWQRRVNLGARNEGLKRDDARKSVEQLFDLLENAIPEILLR
jgi:hypothetical protein